MRVNVIKTLSLWRNLSSMIYNRNVFLENNEFKIDYFAIYSSKCIAKHIVCVCVCVSTFLHICLFAKGKNTGEFCQLNI